MEDILEIGKSLEDSGLSFKGVSETIQNETVKMVLGTLGARLLGNKLAGKGITRAGYASKGKGIMKAGYRSKLDF